VRGEERVKKEESREEGEREEEEGEREEEEERDKERGEIRRERRGKMGGQGEECGRRDRRSWKGEDENSKGKREGTLELSHFLDEETEAERHLDIIYPVKVEKLGLNLCPYAVPLLRSIKG